MESALPRLQAVLQFTRDLDERLSAAGVDGLEGALELYRRLKATLDAIPDAEVVRMMEEVRSLGRALSRLVDELEEIRRLKTLVQS